MAIFGEVESKRCGPDKRILKKIVNCDELGTTNVEIPFVDYPRCIAATTLVDAYTTAPQIEYFRAHT